MLGEFVHDEALLGEFFFEAAEDAEGVLHEVLVGAGQSAGCSRACSLGGSRGLAFLLLLAFGAGLILFLVLIIKA